MIVILCNHAMVLAQATSSALTLESSELICYIIYYNHILNRGDPNA